MSQSFGQWLAEQVKARRISLRHLSHESGVSVTYLSNLTRGKPEHPSPDICEKLAIGLGTSKEEVMLAAGHVSRYEVSDPYALKAQRIILDAPPDRRKYLTDLLEVAASN